MKKTLVLLCIILASSTFGKARFDLHNDPIDVVIPCIPRDLDILEYCIQGIKENCVNLRRVIVVSKERLSENAEWFPESEFPFSYDDVYIELTKGRNKVHEGMYKRTGWYLQQLIKLYSIKVIPDISTNVLILDADIVFNKRTTFLNTQNGAKFAYSYQNHKPYHSHASKLYPSYKRIKNKSGICHHMLMQKSVIDNLFDDVESLHKISFWKAFCRCIDDSGLSFAGASEYELYFNYALINSDQFTVRNLRYKPLFNIKRLPVYKKSNLDIIGFQYYNRKHRKK